MISNYLKIAFRNLLKNKSYTFINVTGLAIGIASCLLIFLYVYHELSFDRFHDKSGQIFRVIQHEKPIYRGEENFAVTPIPLAPRLAEYHPEVEDFTRIGNLTRLVKNGDESFRERIHFADPSILNMFDFPLINGEKKTALDDAYSIVITRSMAEKYFGSLDVLNQTISIQFSGEEFQEFIIQGVAEDIPTNSSIQFDFLIPHQFLISLFPENVTQSWGAIFNETYLQLRPQSDLEHLEAQFTKTVREPYMQAFRDDLVEVILQPLTEIHLNPAYSDGLEPTSNPKYSVILISIALAVLLIACINFMILAVGRSTGRTKEVGMRKVLGSGKKHLRYQFLGESILLSLFALIVGIFLVELFLPTFNELSNSTLSFKYNGAILLVLIGLVIVIGLGAGSYPAFFLSSLNPIQILKGNYKIGGKSRLREALIIIQFFISVFLISATFIMIRQLDFLQNKNLGFNRENIITIELSGTRQERNQTLERLRNELKDRNQFLGITGSSNIFGNEWARAGFRANDETFRQFYAATVDHDFISTMGIELIEGRDFSQEVTSDIGQAIIINETMAREYGWSEAIGESLPGPAFPFHTVVGVVKDFHYQSLHSQINPMVIMLSDSIGRGVQDIDGAGFSGLNYISISLAPDNLEGNIKIIEDTWHSIVSGKPFAYEFLDDNIQQQYFQEKRLGEIAGYSAGLAIFIACLGLFGLATLTLRQRTKEIGIKKVLGASIINITLNLSLDFTKLVFFAILLAVPISWILMNQWLEDFAHRINIGLGVFILTGSVVVLVALVSISFQTIRAAMSNPIKSIRSE
ncbi:MAG: FtsX-like permease family protein [Mongoliibacter sp.]|uniref:ABC transporter permease n=1 Tax=Mongoliibacter sp. TaxID=2022438 RepID=UPI0012F139AE|nr:ABC transporter permease [Mongoliibacter sp.]TVP47354.1 MAG: FtsX-like permease family protein [Mongoliibacter sp.]